MGCNRGYIEAGGDVVAHPLVAKFLEQGDGSGEIGSLEAFAEDAQGGGQRSEGCFPAALAAPQPGEADRGAQFPSPALLPPGDFDGAVKASFRACFVVCFGEVQFAAQAVELRLLETVVVFLDERERLLGSPAGILEAPRLREGLGKDAQVIGQAQAGPRCTIGLPRPF